MKQVPVLSLPTRTSTYLHTVHTHCLPLVTPFKGAVPFLAFPKSPVTALIKLQS